MKKNTLKFSFKEEGYKVFNNILNFNKKGIIYKIDWITSANIKNPGSLKNILNSQLNCKG
jgi:hypothetical protein